MPFELKYNESVEVTKHTCMYLKSHFGGIVAWRKEGEKYYIMCWVMELKEMIEKILLKDKIVQTNNNQYEH